MSDTESILNALKILDKTRITIRDVRALHAIRENPGINGADLTVNLGLEYRSLVKNSIEKLIKMGLIVDEREAEQQAIPCRCYATEKGRAFLEGLGI